MTTECVIQEEGSGILPIPFHIAVPRTAFQLNSRRRVGRGREPRGRAPGTGGAGAAAEAFGHGEGAACGTSGRCGGRALRGSRGTPQHNHETQHLEPKRPRSEAPAASWDTAVSAARALAAASAAAITGGSLVPLASRV